MLKYLALVAGGTVLVALALAAQVPGIAGFESYRVSINARVVQTPPVEKFRSGPDPVPVGTYQEWFFTVVVSNPLDLPMQGVVVTDHFGAELNAQPLDDVPVDVQIVSHTRGRAEKESFTTQVRITWTVGLLEPGQSETLVLRVFTRPNPAGHQEYTSAGVYEQNSGATMRWLDSRTGAQFSASTDPITVTVVDETGPDDADKPVSSQPQPTSTPEPPAPTAADPTATSEPQPTATAASTSTPAAASTETPEPTPTATVAPTGTATPTATPTEEVSP